MDEWTEKNMLYLENGGNALALAYFKQHNIISKQSGIDYKSSYVADYKKLLAQKINKIYRA